MLRDTKQSEENWITCVRNGKDENSSEMKHSTLTLRHTLYPRAFRFPIDAQRERVPSAMECQLKRDKTNRRTRELSTDKAVRRLRYGLCTRFDRGPVWHTVWIHRRQNFILDTYRIQFLPIAKYNVISCARTEKNIKNDKWTWEIFFLSDSWYTVADNFRA